MVMMTWRVSSARCKVHDDENQRLREGEDLAILVKVAEC